MKLKTNQNTYEASNCYLEINPDNIRDIKAYSYGWWRFVTTDSVGNIFLNYSTYSNSTSKHQYKVSDIYRNRLGIKSDFTLTNTRESLYDIESALESEITSIKRQISILIKKIKTKGSWRKTNKERRGDIGRMIKHIEKIRLVKNEYLNKKRIPVNLRPGYSIDDIKAHSFYLKNHKGKINKHGLNEFLKSGRGVSHDNASISEDIGKLIDLLDIKADQSKLELAAYRFTNDLAGMIPEIDTPEYKALKNWLKRMDINGRNFNAFKLDKIHTYLINKEKRKNYVPSEPIEFPYHPILDQVESMLDKCRVIRTDQELRAEGRKQSHCIGSKMYQDKMRRGYNAIHYKGHTFLLDSELQLVEAHGRHNSHTPEKLIRDIELAINKADSIELNKVLDGHENSLISA